MEYETAHKEVQKLGAMGVLLGVLDPWWKRGWVAWTEPGLLGPGDHVLEDFQPNMSHNR